MDRGAASLQRNPQNTLPRQLGSGIASREQTYGQGPNPSGSQDVPDRITDYKATVSDRLPFHSAAHAVLAMSLGLEVERVTLDPGLTSLTEPPSHEDGVRFRLAGPMAEQLLVSNLTDCPEPVGWVGRAMVGKKRMRSVLSFFGIGSWSCDGHVERLEGVRPVGRRQPR